MYIYTVYAWTTLYCIYTSINLLCLERLIDVSEILWQCSAIGRNRCQSIKKDNKRRGMAAWQHGTLGQFRFSVEVLLVPPAVLPRMPNSKHLLNGAYRPGNATCSMAARLHGCMT